MGQGRSKNEKSRRPEPDYGDLKQKVCPPLSEGKFDQLRLAFNEEMSKCSEIDQEGLEGIILQVNQGINPEKLRAVVPALYRVYDQNRDTAVDLGEFITVYAILANNMSQEKDLLNLLFDVIDTNNSGNISKSELSEIIKVIYNMDGSSSEDLNTEELADIIFKQIDINADGKITKRDFIEALTDKDSEHTLQCNILYRNLKQLFI